jgi:pimeloyl-ACP methyl ester carboxylesterase
MIRVFSLRKHASRGRLRRLLFALLASLVGAGVTPLAAHAGTVTTYTGAFADGAKYLIQVPSPWNGTLLLYSHGYVTPGASNPAEDVGDPYTGAYLLAAGFALAGSSYATTGWAVHEAIPDQIETLDTFNTVVGEAPTRTIAWGHSLGGIITAGLLQQYPGRFDAAMPMCGVLAGGVGTWNEALDAAFAIQQLLGGGVEPQVVHISNPLSNLATAEYLLATAQATAQGRARIALAGALSDLPGWYTTGSPEPAATDYTAQEANQYQWLANVDGPFAFAFRAELEARADGNPSWNTGVNYAQQFGKSIDASEVASLYQAAGLNLDADLATLNSAPRISADPAALTYLTQNVVFNGALSGKPVLTMHTIGDGLVVDNQEQAYRSAVQDAKDSALLRQVFVDRAGHCAFTPAETIAGLDALLTRLQTGKWAGVTGAGNLNAAAEALGPLNNLPPAFVATYPAPFLRPYDSASR